LLAWNRQTNVRRRLWRGHGGFSLSTKLVQEIDSDAT
jgi:hypothetical protein